MKAILAAAILLFAIACGQSQGHQAASSPSAPASPQPLLFAVLQANGTPNAWTYNTVVIAGLDGRERATATFAPMSVPILGCMGAVLPPSAHVAAGKVFFADSKGVVRSLSIDGTVAVAATFPMTSTQQILSFAVSPDGTSLLGTIFTVPSNAGLACGEQSTTANYTFDAYAAPAGGTSTLVYRQAWSAPHDVLALTGWDAVGPIGTYPTVWATQGGGPGSTLGIKVRVNPATIQPSAVLTDPAKCLVWDSNANGAFVCLGNAAITAGGTADQRVSQTVSVRQAGDVELWHSTVVGQNGQFGPYLSPDAQHVQVCCNDLNLAEPHELLVGRDGSQVNLVTGFYAAGWLDALTMIGYVNANGGQQPTFSYVSTNAPSTAVSMGFSGTFIGTVRA